MSNGIIRVPRPVNEPVRSYAPGTPERASIKKRLDAMRNERADMALVIGGEEVRTGDIHESVAPFDHAHVLGTWHGAGRGEVEKAIKASQDAWHDWSEMPWIDRAAVFLKAADLLAGPWRDTINAATMLNQAKTVHQAEIDAACELIDFFRFNAHYMEFIYEQQPQSAPGMWNYTEYRALEGFVLAITPFNFTSIAGNLPTSAAMMGNTVIWKPAQSAMLSAWYIMKMLEEAGLPPGVINLVPGKPAEVAGTAMNHRQFAGIHFTGSTGVFQDIWKTIGNNIANYAAYPRIVGETGGKDFIFAHPSADVAALATAMVRGAFEFQGQKCSAASRAYIPRSLWKEVKERVGDQLGEIRMGDPTDFRNFVSAVIDRKAHEKISSYVDHAKNASDAEILFGGKHDDSKGYFIEPTVVLTDNPDYQSLCEEIFGPVLSVYVYDDARMDDTLELVDKGSPYGLTGAIFAQDRRAIVALSKRLRHAAGNFYINDKPTGAVVGQQPFGGSRASGTNDKAGSYLNLLRWTSQRAIKETFVPPHHFAYPFMDEK